MAKAITKGQLQGSMERVKDSIAETAGTAAAAVLQMGNALSTPMTGATASLAGAAGMAPAPAAGKQASFLRGDGTWSMPFVVSTSTPQTSNALWIKPTDE